MVQIQFESPKKLFSIAHEPAHSGLLHIPIQNIYLLTYVCNADDYCIQHFFYPFAIHIYLSFSIERTKSTNKNLHKTLYKCLPYKKVLS